MSNRSKVLQNRVVRTLPNGRCYVESRAAIVRDRDWRERELAVIEELESEDRAPSALALDAYTGEGYNVAKLRLRALKREGKV